MPYKLINQEALYRPSVMFGSVKDKIAAEYYFDEKK